ncbi:MAG: hypothetical protein HY720_05585, partial [Planctomycetes bacterium]|nr:hypothetical protein [Planctomycetota bacterium]
MRGLPSAASELCLAGSFEAATSTLRARLHLHRFPNRERPVSAQDGVALFLTGAGRTVRVRGRYDMPQSDVVDLLVFYRGEERPDVRYPFDLARDEEERRNWRPIASWGGSTLGLGAIVFAHQAARGKPAGLATSGNWGLAPGCERNVALLRAVQFAPHVYSFIPGWL